MLKTLIVEDSVMFRQILSETLLSRFPSMVISEAASGNEALRQIEAGIPDLIFMDIQLPGENGLELTQKIKSRYPDVVIIILTNHDLPEYREAAFRYKATHFLPKDSFLAMVDSILSASHK